MFSENACMAIATDSRYPSAETMGCNLNPTVEVKWETEKVVEPMSSQRYKARTSGVAPDGNPLNSTPTIAVPSNDHDPYTPRMVTHIC